MPDGSIRGSADGGPSLNCSTRQHGSQERTSPTANTSTYDLQRRKGQLGETEPQMFLLPLKEIPYGHQWPAPLVARKESGRCGEAQKPG